MYKSHFKYLLAWALSLSMLYACAAKAPSECKELCSLPEAQQYKLFKSYPVEKQFDLYLNCKNESSCVRDSASFQDLHGQWMAEDNKAAPFLLEQLKRERDAQIQHDIIYILRFMAVNGHLKGQRHVAEEINQAVARMESSFKERVFRDEWILKQSQNWAREIENNI